MKEDIIKFLLFAFNTFCAIVIIVSCINTYEVKTNKDNVLNVNDNVNIENIGDEVKLEATNNNDEISYKIMDESIVKIDEDGTLTGVSEGSTEVIITNKDKTKKQTITVNVGKDSIEDYNKTTTNTSNKDKTTSTTSKKDETTVKKTTTSNKNTTTIKKTTTSKKSTTTTKKNTTSKKNTTTTKKTTTSKKNTTTTKKTTTSKKNTTTTKKTTTSKKSTTTTKKVTSISLNKSNTEIYLNSSNTSFTISATVYPSNATNKTIYWSSSNSDVATVNNGTVSAKNPGVTTITAKTADGNKTASILVTVKKKIVIVIGASQVARMSKEWYNVSEYKSSKYNYSTSNETLSYIYLGGSGIDWQYTTGYTNAWNNIISKYKNYKNYTYFYIFYPLVGNTIKNFTCNEISSSNSVIKEYAKNYNNTIKQIKNNGYNVLGYVVSMHPVKVSQANKDTIVTNENKNACSKKYRSNYKYYQFNKAMKEIINNNYSSNLKYESLFIEIMDTKNGKKVNYDYKITYNTTDGIHWDNNTTHTYVNMMLGYYNDL